MLWVVLGFGLYKGLWLGTLRLFVGTMLASLSTSFAKPVIGSYVFEASGILMFVSAVFVAAHRLEFIRAARPAKKEAHRGDDSRAATPRRAWYGTVAAGFAGAAIVGAYVALERDRFVPPPNGVVTIGVIAPVPAPTPSSGIRTIANGKPTLLRDVAMALPRVQGAER